MERIDTAARAAPRRAAPERRSPPAISGDGTAVVPR
jgi:hypothetical protein